MKQTDMTPDEAQRRGRRPRRRAPARPRLPRHRQDHRPRRALGPARDRDAGAAPRPAARPDARAGPRAARRAPVPAPAARGARGSRPHVARARLPPRHALLPEPRLRAAARPADERRAVDGRPRPAHDARIRGPGDAYGEHLTSEAFIERGRRLLRARGLPRPGRRRARARSPPRQEHAADRRVRAPLPRAPAHESHPRLSRADPRRRAAAQSRTKTSAQPCAGASRTCSSTTRRSSRPRSSSCSRSLNLDHLVCAGDPDSAIEAFRGADPRWLERFAELAPSTNGSSCRRRTASARRSATSTPT